jgi:hypothetical protein
MKPFLAFLKQLLFRCTRGRHQWIGLQSEENPERVLYCCETCMKTQWTRP